MYNTICFLLYVNNLYAVSCVSLSSLPTSYNVLQTGNLGLSAEKWAKKGITELYLLSCLFSWAMSSHLISEFLASLD